MARDLGFDPAKNEPFYFLSYNSEDMERVGQYARAAVARGLSLWYDKGIEVGSKWERSIADHIGDCEAVVMFLSRGIFKKAESYVYKEYEMATSYFDKKVVIVLLDNVEKREVPRQFVSWWIDINHMQCIHAYQLESIEACVTQIMNAVGFESKQTPAKEEETSSTPVAKEDENKHTRKDKKEGKSSATDDKTRLEAVRRKLAAAEEKSKGKTADEGKKEDPTEEKKSDGMSPLEAMRRKLAKKETPKEEPKKDAPSKELPEDLSEEAKKAIEAKERVYKMKCALHGADSEPAKTAQRDLEETRKKYI